MIVKEEEWKDLQNAKDILEKEYLTKLKEKEEKINSLEGIIKELETKVKPDEITVKVCFGEPSTYGRWTNYHSYVYIADSKLVLSSGIKTQVIRILSGIIKNLQKRYIKEVESKETIFSNLLQQKNELLKELKGLPYFITRKNILKICKKYE